MKRNRQLLAGNEDWFFNSAIDDFYPYIKNQHNNADRLLSTDIKEVENGYEFQIEIPGIQKECITLNLDKGYLTVKANTTLQKDEDCDGYLCRERQFGLFSRSYYVGEVKEDDIKAKLDNGVLKIFIPKLDKKLLNKKTITIE